IEMYMLNRQRGRIILESVEHGPLLWPSVTEDEVTRLKKYSELSATEAIQADCVVKATNIILQALPSEIYALVSTHKASLSNQTNEIKNMMAGLFQMNSASTSGSGSLPSNTVANSKGKLKAITTRSGRVLDGPTVPTPTILFNLEEDKRVEETLIDPNLAEYTIKVPPPLVQKYKPPSQRKYVVHQRDPLHSNIPYPSRMLKQK
nr:hypothetical protein [Tanacetum cinerariifolium]